jgi:hypothetical protein
MSYLLQMVILHSYVKEPEGILNNDAEWLMMIKDDG